MTTHLLTSTQVATALGVSPRTLQDWAYRGEGPAYIKVGNLRRYQPADIEAFIARNRVATA